MSEVKRFDCTNGKAQHCYGCYQMTESAEGDYVSSADFDAQRLRADTAEADLLRTSDALIAAEQRIANHESTLRHFANCADIRQVGTSAMDYVAALNPNPNPKGVCHNHNYHLGECTKCGAISATE